MNHRHQWIYASLAACACLASAAASVLAFMVGRTIMTMIGVTYVVAAVAWLYTTIMHVKAALIYRRIKQCRE